MRILSQQDSKFRLLLIGATQDAYGRKIQNMVANSSILYNKVKILAFMEQAEINCYLNAADIGVWHKQPSVSIQQAMATGEDALGQ